MLLSRSLSTAGQPAGRVGQVVTGSKDEKSQGEHQFGFKEMAALIGVIAVMIGIVGYGIYSQRSRAGSDSSVATIIEPAPVSRVDQHQSLAVRTSNRFRFLNQRPRGDPTGEES